MRLKNYLAPDGMITTLSEAVLTVAGDPDLKAEAEAALPMLREQARQADPDVMVRIMTPYQEPFNRTSRDKEQWKAFWLVYIEALEGVSPGALKAGLAAYMKLPSSNFFPAPGPLLALCQKEQEAVARRWRIAQAALRLQPGSFHQTGATDAYAATFGESA